MSVKKLVNNLGNFMQYWDGEVEEELKDRLNKKKIKKSRFFEILVHTIESADEEDKVGVALRNEFGLTIVICSTRRCRSQKENVEMGVC